MPIWTSAGRGEEVDWRALLQSYTAAVDLPAAAFWREIAEVYPSSVILLSTRDPDEWWASASATIFAGEGPPVPGAKEMMAAILARSGHGVRDKESAIASFVAHNENVRRTAPKERLVEWTVQDGWGPLCRALDVPVPKTPFPRTNTREDWAARARARG